MNLERISNDPEYQRLNGKNEEMNKSKYFILQLSTDNINVNMSATHVKHVIKCLVNLITNFLDLQFFRQQILFYLVNPDI